MKFKSRIKKIEKKLKPGRILIFGEKLDNGNYLLDEVQKEVTPEELDKMEGDKFLIEWVEPKKYDE